VVVVVVVVVVVDSSISGSSETLANVGDRHSVEKYSQRFTLEN
jgi:hypothetical protein